MKNGVAFDPHHKSSEKSLQVLKGASCRRQLQVAVTIALLEEHHGNALASRTGASTYQLPSLIRQEYKARPVMVEVRIFPPLCANLTLTSLLIRSALPRDHLGQRKHTEEEKKKKKDICKPPRKGLSQPLAK